MKLLSANPSVSSSDSHWVPLLLHKALTNLILKQKLVRSFKW